MLNILYYIGLVLTIFIIIILLVIILNVTIGTVMLILEELKERKNE